MFEWFLTITRISLHKHNFGLKLETFNLAGELSWLSAAGMMATTARLEERFAESARKKVDPKFCIYLINYLFTNLGSFWKWVNHL
jgi:hypothetical protein